MAFNPFRTPPPPPPPPPPLEVRESSWYYTRAAGAASDPLAMMTAGAAPEQAMAIPTVFQCVSLLSEKVAEFGLYEVDAAGRPRDPQPDLLRRPDPFRSRAEFLESTCVAMLTEQTGEAYWHVARSAAGQPIGLEVIGNDRVSTSWANLAQTRRRFDVTNLGTFIEGSGDFVRVPYMTLTGRLHGLNPLRACSTVWLGEVAADQLAASNFRDGVFPTGTFESESSITESQADRLKDKIMARYRGSREPLVLGGGIKYTPIAITARDAQWIEHRQWTSGDMARAYGVHLGLLSLPVTGSNLTYSNVRDARVDTLNHGMRRLMGPIGSAFARLLSPASRVLWDVSTYLPPLEAVEHQPAAAEARNPALEQAAP